MNEETGDEESRLSGLDVLFLIGLGLFIFFLFLVHPWTGSFVYDDLVFWSSVTMLFLSMAPDYVNKETAGEWLEEYRGAKVQGLYERVYRLVESGYFDSDFFFALGIVLSIDGFVFMFMTGWITNPVFGVSYGVLLRAILS